MRPVLVLAMTASLLTACGLPRPLDYPAPLGPAVTVARRELEDLVRSGDTTGVRAVVSPDIRVQYEGQSYAGAEAWALFERGMRALGGTAVGLKLDAVEDCRTEVVERSTVVDVAVMDTSIQRYDLRWLRTPDGPMLSEVAVHVLAPNRPVRNRWRCSSMVDVVKDYATSASIQSGRTLRVALYPAAHAASGGRTEGLLRAIEGTAWRADAYAESRLADEATDEVGLMAEASMLVRPRLAVRAHVSVGDEAAIGASRLPLDLAVFRAQGEQLGVSAEWRFSYLRAGAGALVQRSKLVREPHSTYTESGEPESTALLPGVTGYLGTTLPLLQNLGLDILLQHDQVATHDARVDDARAQLDWSATTARLGFSMIFGRRSR